MSLNSVISKFYSYFVILNLLFWVVWNVYRIREFSYCWKYTHFLSVISSKPCSECNKWFQIIGNSKTLERFWCGRQKVYQKSKTQRTQFSTWSFAAHSYFVHTTVGKLGKRSINRGRCNDHIFGSAWGIIIKKKIDGAFPSAIKKDWSVLLII